MLAHARRSTDEWNDFLDSFVDDEELIARIKAKCPRQQSAGYQPRCAGREFFPRRQ
ncbi:hypothetical protein AB395_00006062 (plasmid) [Sinorhizobium fredii CCBAU 45436]|nr:hypothetical protein AB395_00006062 [Sinorhizobium fredii CCBAU 45436]